MLWCSTNTTKPITTLNECQGFTKSQITILAALHLKGKLMFSRLERKTKMKNLPLLVFHSVNLVHKVFPFTSFLPPLSGRGCVHKLMSCVVTNLNMNHACNSTKWIISKIQQISLKVWKLKINDPTTHDLRFPKMVKQLDEQEFEYINAVKYISTGNSQVVRWISLKISAVFKNSKTSSPHSTLQAWKQLFESAQWLTGNSQYKLFVAKKKIKISPLHQKFYWTNKF